MPRLKARFNEQNYSINTEVIRHDEYFNLPEEYEASMDKIRDEKKLNIQGICFSIEKYEGATNVAIIREEALQKQEGEVDFKNAMVLVPIAVDSEELIEELKQHFLNRKVRCRKIQDAENGQYSLSLSLIPESIDRTVSGLAQEIIDRKDHIEIVLKDLEDKTEHFNLTIMNISPEDNAELVRLLRMTMGMGMIMDADKDNNVLSLFAANILPKDISPEGDAFFVRMMFMPFEYCEYTEDENIIWNT